MAMNFEGKNILGKNKLLSKYWLSYPTQKTGKSLFFSKTTASKKKMPFQESLNYP